MVYLVVTEKVRILIYNLKVHQIKVYFQFFKKDKKNPVLVDKYIMGMELEVDAISDGEDVLIPGIMEHLERAGEALGAQGA